MMYNGIVYSYKSSSNKYYIGRTIHEHKRKNTHKWYAKNSNSTGVYAFQNAIKKYGFENFEYTVLYRYSSENRKNTIQVLNEKEIYYIDKFKKEGKSLYNMTIGGDGGSPMLGRHFSEESKEKMRLSHLGHTQSEETKKKRSLSLKGKRHLSKEEVNKLVLGRKKNLKKVAQLDTEGNLIKIWDNCPSVDIVPYGALRRCLNNIPRKDRKPKTYGGFRWMYLKDYTKNQMYEYDSNN